MAEERTTEEERNHIMEARKRAANRKKRQKLKTLGRGRSTETEDEDDDDEDDEQESSGKQHTAAHFPFQ